MTTLKAATTLICLAMVAMAGPKASTSCRTDGRPVRALSLWAYFATSLMVIVVLLVPVLSEGSRRRHRILSVFSAFTTLCIHNIQPPTSTGMILSHLHRPHLDKKLYTFQVRPRHLCHPSACCGMNGGQTLFCLRTRMTTGVQPSKWDAALDADIMKPSEVSIPDFLIAHLH